MRDSKYQTFITDKVKQQDGDGIQNEYDHKSYMSYIYDLIDSYTRTFPGVGVPEFSQESDLPVILGIGPDLNLGKEVGVPFYTEEHSTGNTRQMMLMRA